MADMRYFHGVVKTELVYDSDARAEEIARNVGREIEELGGKLDVGRNFGDDYAILIVTLPTDATVDPGALIKGVDFHEVHMSQAPLVEDKGIQG